MNIKCPCRGNYKRACLYSGFTDSVLQTSMYVDTSSLTQIWRIPK